MILTDPIFYRTKQVTFDELKDGSTIPLECACDECGKVFSTTKYRITRNGHQLCRQCALRAKQRKDLPVGSRWGRLTVLGPSERIGYSICRCECGTIGEHSNVELKRHTTKSCGCYRREKSSDTAKKYLPRLSGANHPNWKGGITDERHIVESSKEYKAFRLTVLERDGNRCRKCGKSEDLCVHHVLDFMAHPEMRCNADNGVTLCRSCHEQFHSIYGKGTKAGAGEFGRAEIDEYLNVQ